MEPQQLQFLHTQGPVARRGFRSSLRFCAPEGFCLLQGVTPVNGGPGKGDYEHEVLIWSRPRRRFGDFAAVGKVTRRPQAAKPPCKKRNCSIIAPSSVWPDGQPPSPLGGRLLGGVPSSGPFGAAFAQGEGLGGRPPPRRKPAFWRGIGKQPLPLFSRFSISSFCARLNVRFCFSATRKAGPSHA